MLKCIFAKNIVNKSYKLNKISLLFFLEITVAKKKKMMMKKKKKVEWTYNKQKSKQRSRG